MVVVVECKKDRMGGKWEDEVEESAWFGVKGRRSRFRSTFCQNNLSEGAIQQIDREPPPHLSPFLTTTTKT